jgi:hypothetical protein
MLMRGLFLMPLRTVAPLPRSSPMSADFAAQLAPGLLDPATPPPGIVLNAQGASVFKRYNVYRNNVTVSLISALAAVYPAVQRIVGEDFFRAMARTHVRETPPRSPLLFEYGREFPSFIAAYPYAAEMPWLADVARIERAWLDAYHAADAAPLTAEALAALPAAALPDLRLQAHPATHWVHSPFPAVSIFAMNRQPGPVGPITCRDAQTALVTRPGREVVVTHLPDEAALFVQALLEGQPLGEAAQAALSADPSFDLTAHLAALMEAGVFASLPTETLA